MQENSTSDPHPFGNLPVEIARIIFEIAALLSPRTAATLCLVSRTVFRWVEPALYHTVILRGERSIMAFTRAMKYRNDPLFFATNVKTICFGNMLSGLVLLTDLRKTPDALSLISSTCTGIERLGYGVTSYQHTHPHLSSIEDAVFADAGTRFPCLTHLSILDFDAHSLRVYLPPQITHLHLDCYDQGRNIRRVDWAALFRQCTRLAHLVLSGHALNDSLSLRVAHGTQYSSDFDLLDLLRPVIACLPSTLSTLVISVVPDAYLVTMLPQARNLVKQIIESDERILMISPRSFYRGRIDGLYCCEGNNVYNYGPHWEHSKQGDDMWEFAERCIASRKRTRVASQYELHWVL